VPHSFAAWRVNVNPWRERRQDDIATVQVAVQSIAPFEDYIDSLQPHFTMTEEKALDEAIAQTRVQDTQEMQAFTAALQVRGPEKTTSSEQTTTNDGSGAASKTTSTKTQKENPGALSDAAVPGAVARTLATATAIDPATTKLEASIRYNAATALIQRVALLSNYVRDAAVRSHTKPYLVRMLVTVLPAAATRGYDAYTTVSFFSTSKDLEGRPITNLIAASEFAESSPRRLDQAHFDYDHQPSATKRSELEQTIFEEELNRDVLESAKKIDCDERPIDTIPLLVTDSVTSSLQSDMLERILDISAAAQAIQANTRVGGGFRAQRDRIDKSLTRNINGVMTVSRVAQNSIEVRLGAIFGNRDDALVPRTYDVTALLLFPLAPAQSKFGFDDYISTDVIPCSAATYTAQTTFRDSRNGKVARAGNVNSLNEKVAAMLANTFDKADVEIAPDLVKYARAGDYQGFRIAIGDPRQAALLWPQVVAVVSRHSFSRGLFQAPVRDVEIFDTLAQTSLFDDGKVATMTLPGGRNLRADRLVGTLVLTPPDKTKTFHLVANSVEVNNDGRRAKFTFDSPTKFTKEVCDIVATVRYVSGTRDWERGRVSSQWGPSLVTFVPALEPAKDPPKEQRFTLRVGAKTITAKDGTGGIRVSLKRKKADDTFPMFFSVDGADVVSVDGSLKASGADWKSDDDGSGIVTLANLVPGNAVTIHAFSLKDKKVTDEQNVAVSVQPQLVVITAQKEK